ncbi:MAG: sugar transferase [Clostridia bacterium]
MYAKYLKRIIDFAIATISFIVLLPLFIVIIVLIKLKVGSPAIFRQKRPGKDGKIFVLYKFRTMTDEKDENGRLLSDELRLTKFGKTLRQLSLDELPQLINIIRGDMSIIGPRPLFVNYLKLYSKEQNRRHDVRPGLTGLAQINGRNQVKWADKFKYDVEYVDNLSVKLDIYIFIKTVYIVIKKSGIAQDGKATVELFKGNEKNEDIEPVFKLK